MKVGDYVQVARRMNRYDRGTRGTITQVQHLEPLDPEYRVRTAQGTSFWAMERDLIQLIKRSEFVTR